MSRLTEIWLPGVIFTLAGGLLGWGISYRDTQTQISGLNRANEQLQGQNGELHEQLGMLKEQNSGLKEQRLALGGINNQLAGVGHNVSVLVRLVLDAQGHVIGGDVLMDSQGRAIMNSSGHPIMTSPRRP